MWSSMGSGDEASYLALSESYWGHTETPHSRQAKKEDDICENEDDLESDGCKEFLVHPSVSIFSILATPN